MRILIVKTSSLGDIIHTFPVINWLKQKKPEVKIDWVVETPFAELLEAHPSIDHVYRIDTKHWRKGKKLKTLMALHRTLRKVHYDVLFDLQGNTKSGFFSLCAKASQKVGFGWKGVAEWPNLLSTNRKFNPPLGNNIRHDYLCLVQSFFQDHTQFEDIGVLLRISHDQRETIKNLLKSEHLMNRPRVMVCPGSAWANKRLTTAALINWLQSLYEEYNCCFLFIWGNEEELTKAKRLHSVFHHNSIIVEKLPIPVLQNLMDQMDYVIAMDSLPLHLAATTHVPTFGVFGASSAQKYRPLGNKHGSFQGSCPYNQKFEKRCPRLRSCKTGACIRALDGNAIHTAFDLNN